MCGRFTLKRAPQELVTQFELPSLPVLVETPRYNVAPTQEIIVVVARPEVGREGVVMRWGLIPSSAKGKDGAARRINARAETVFELGIFKNAARRRRCLVLADGFLEWKVEGSTKWPHLFERRDGAAFAMAGIWDRWRAPDGEVIESCAVITTDANGVVSPLHDRMPVILPPDAYALWLDPTVRIPEAVQPLLRPLPDTELTITAVSRRVNNVKNDDVSCLGPPEPEPAPEPQKEKPKKNQLGFDF